MARGWSLCVQISQHGLTSQRAKGSVPRIALGLVHRLRPPLHRALLALVVGVDQPGALLDRLAVRDPFGIGGESTVRRGRSDGRHAPPLGRSRRVSTHAEPPALAATPAGALARGPDQHGARAGAHARPPSAGPARREEGDRLVRSRARPLVRRSERPSRRIRRRRSAAEPARRSGLRRAWARPAGVSAAAVGAARAAVGRAARLRSIGLQTDRHGRRGAAKAGGRQGRLDDARTAVT